MRNRTAATALGLLTSLALAATLLTGNAASADRPAAQDDVRAGAGTYTGAAPADKAGAAPVTVTAQGSTSLADCWTTVNQPGGVGTTIYVSYNNCGTVAWVVTPNSQAVNGSGTYTYVGWCAVIDPGYIGTWAITPDWFPPADTHNYSVTTCL